MRRSDMKITDKRLVTSILEKEMVYRIGLCNNSAPYVIPVIFGYKDNFLYIHSAQEGKKIEILKKNNNICFEVESRVELVKSDNACNWGMKYYSVIGFGKAYFVKDIVTYITGKNPDIERIPLFPTPQVTGPVKSNSI